MRISSHSITQNISNLTHTSSPAIITMDATKKSGSQVKKEASLAKRENNKRKAEGGFRTSSSSSSSGGGGGGYKKQKYSAAESKKRSGNFGSRSYKPEGAGGAGAAGSSSTGSASASASVNSSSSSGSGTPNLPPKQKKKIDKPKHLKRKLEQAQEQVTANAEGAESIAAALESQQHVLIEKKQEAVDKFYQLCRTLVGEEKWDKEKQDVYDKLLKEGGGQTNSFLPSYYYRLCDLYYYYYYYLVSLIFI
jgi:hypothetical protein